MQPSSQHHSPAGPSASASHTPHGAYSHGGPQPLAPPSPQPQPPTWEFSPEPYVPAPANLPAYELDEGIPTGGADPEPLLFFPPRTSASSDASGASAASPTSAAGPSAGFRVPDVFIPPLSASSSSSQPHPQHPQHPQQPLHGGAGSNQVPNGLPRGMGKTAGAAAGGGGGGKGPSDSLWTLTDQPGVDLFRAGPAVWNRLRQVSQSGSLSHWGMGEGCRQSDSLENMGGGGCTWLR